MSDQWLYRIYGQEFGPVSLELVRTLVAAGTIAPDDEVRNVSRSNWILACAAAELNSPEPSDQTIPEVERRVGRDEWYCRGYAGDYGPLTLSELIQLAADGELEPDEEIKCRADDYWKKVCSVRRLVELLPFQDQPRALHRIKHEYPHNQFQRQEPINLLEPVDILPFPAVSKPLVDDHNVTSSLSEIEQIAAQWGDPVVTELKPSDNTRDQMIDVDSPAFDETSPSIDHQLKNESSSEIDQWTGWIGGSEFGPVDYTELLMWAVTGRLLPTDFVRRGREGQYVPAVNVPCLFTVRAAADSLARRQPVPSLKIADLPREQHETPHSANEKLDQLLADRESGRGEPDVAVEGSREIDTLSALGNLQQLVSSLVNRLKK